MRGIILGVILSVATIPAHAQTGSSQCRWVGGTWTCHSQQNQGVDWSRGVIRPPDFVGAFEAGAEARRRDEERRAVAPPPQVMQPSGPATGSPIPTDYLDRWYVAARPRMAIYPDFDEKVYSKNVEITPAMVWLMSTSPYAADISYYLATHKAEAAAISRMPLVQAGRAIDALGAKFASQEKAAP